MVSENSPIEYSPLAYTEDDDDFFIYVDNIWPISKTYWTLDYSDFAAYFAISTDVTGCIYTWDITSDSSSTDMTQESGSDFVTFYPTGSRKKKVAYIEFDLSKLSYDYEYIKNKGVIIFQIECCYGTACDYQQVNVYLEPYIDYLISLEHRSDLLFGSDVKAITDPYTFSNELPGDTWKYAYETYTNSKPKFDSENYIFFCDFYEYEKKRKELTMLEFRSPDIHDWNTYSDEITIKLTGDDYEAI